MKELNKAKKNLILTAKDFGKALGDSKVKKFTDMLNNNLYHYRVKLALYRADKISPKGFLFNNDIYNLPLGKKNAKGEILIDNDILVIFDRFLLGEQLVKKGDALTAFISDHSDELYEALRTNATKEKKISEDEYIQLFSLCYNDVSDRLLGSKVSEIIEEDMGLGTAMEDYRVEQEEKVEAELKKKHND